MVNWEERGRGEGKEFIAINCENLIFYVFPYYSMYYFRLIIDYFANFNISGDKING